MRDSVDGEERTDEDTEEVRDKEMAPYRETMVGRDTIEGRDERKAPYKGHHSEKRKEVKAL